jgi:DNA invertase Pin-like site-specific DNA recombinase
MGARKMGSRIKCYSYLRFSTPEQSKGDSLRRQLEMSETYASERGLILDDSLELQDMGLSAYRGHHRTKGALGGFLRLVEEEEIPRGSTLIVESLDRLSREQVLDALNLFTSIIRAGIKVVTLQDSMEYTEESINSNFGQLLMSIVIMSRAHEESLAKSRRLSAAWHAKRQTAHKRRLTKKSPDWLEPQENGDWFDLIEDRCQIIEQIYTMYDEGKGKRLIEKELNQGDGWKPKNGWRKSYIDKILRNPAVIGLFQPHRKINGKRVPVGEPINNYYPRVIPDELFFRVQERLDRNVNYGGRTGKVNNLFSHIAKCGYCGAPMELVSKGKPPKGGLYLVCDSARRGRGCAYYSIKYEGLEKLLLNYCKGLHVDEVLPDKEKQSELAQLKSQSSALAGELGQVQDWIANLTDSIADTEDKRVRQTLQKKLSELLDDRERLEWDKSRIEAKIAQLSKASESIEEQLQSIEQLLDYMQSASKEKLIDVRLRLRDKLRQLIQKIIVYPVGPAIMTPELVEEGIQAVLDVQARLKGTDKIEKFREELEKKIDNKEEQIYRLEFEGGSYRWLKPYDEPPLMVEIDSNTGESRFIMDGELKPLPESIRRWVDLNTL